MEIWKDIPEYIGKYQASNLGNIKSLRRKSRNKNCEFNIKERILKKSISKQGYYQVCFSQNGIQKVQKIHQLVAICFLNHKKCKYKKVVHHIDNNPLNNNVENLEITTQRNNSHTHHKGTSKYKGVHLRKDTKKFQAQITIKNKNINLGCYVNEYDAHLAYKSALDNLL